MDTKWIALGALILSACGSSLRYSAPDEIAPQPNSRTVAKTKDQVWSALVSGLSAQFFVINNIDKDSGLINISYSGDPELYIDCGTIASTPRGVGTKNSIFPGARRFQIYEVTSGIFYGVVSRRVSLDGRMNIVVAETLPDSTDITVNARYIVQISGEVRDAYGRLVDNLSGTLGFNTGASDTTPDGTTCRANGKFEEQVLNIVQ